MKIIVRCNVDAKSGFGHFSRCLNLVRTQIAMYPNTKVLFWGNYNEFAIELLNKYLIPFHLSYFNDFNKDFDFLNVDADLILVDSYEYNQLYLNNITQQLKSKKLILIDDERKLESYSAVDLVVNFRVNAQNFMKYDSKNTALGVQYFIHKPELTTIRDQKSTQSWPRPPLNILIFMGGGSKYEISENIAQSITKISPNFNIKIIHQEYISGFDVVKPHYNIESLYLWADLVINGGGLTKYECAYCLIPSASLSLNSLQHNDTQILKQEHLIFDLGLATIVDDKSLENHLTQFMTDEFLHAKIKQASEKIFMRNSNQNLIKLIYSIF